MYAIRSYYALFAEGQRRYVESLSSYARQFLGVSKKPDVEKIEGLCPAIAIDQKTVGSNPRSTVGTITEIYRITSYNVCYTKLLRFCKPDAFPLAASIERAYAESQRLVFETDLAAMQEPAVQAKMMALGMYPEGQGLWQNLDPGTRNNFV